MNNDRTKKLGEGLSNRHITMISIGGVIGAGLFVGSSSAIAKAGPAVILAYLITSIMVFLVMRMLGEMAVLEPDTGSFSTYACKAIGPWAGFTIGWLYWWFWVLAIPVEAIAGAEILHSWFPSVSVSIYAFCFIVFLSLANFFSTKSFGEFEFWFSLVKVVAIIGFIIIGILAISGIWPLAKMSVVLLIYTTTLVLCRTVWGNFICHFNYGIFILWWKLSRLPQQSHLTLNRKLDVPPIWCCTVLFFFSWSQCLLRFHLSIGVHRTYKKYGTFQYVLMSLNVPGTKLIIDTVVFIAVASCMNAAIYTSSRMLFRLGTRNEAPQAVTKVNYAGVPAIAVFSSTFIGLVCCVINYVFPWKSLWLIALKHRVNCFTRVLGYCVFATTFKT